MAFLFNTFVEKKLKHDDDKPHIANSPLDTDGFTHYLNFVSLGFEGLYQITEPVGFDVANFLVQQNEGRFSRDIYFGNQTSNEVFYDTFGIEKLDKSRIINPQGQQAEYLDMGLFWILETYRRFGFEGKIERILKKEGIQFTIGLLDLANPDTDGYTYFGCNIIQNTEIANYKKQLDTSIDLFSTKNIREESILPATTFRFLRKAVPLFQQSKFKSVIDFIHKKLDSTPAAGPASKYYYYNNCNSIVLNEIPNTTTFSETLKNNDDSAWATADTFKVITAEKTLLNVNVSIENFIIDQEVKSVNGAEGYASNELYVKWGLDINSPLGEEIPLSFTLSEGNPPVHVVLPTTTVTIPTLPAGAHIWVFMKTRVLVSNTAALPKIEAFTTLSKFNLNISASSISLDTVINGVRYIDVLKQCSNFINKLPIEADIFDVDGQYYNNVCWNRALLSMNTSNSRELISSTSPEGNSVGEVVTNTGEVIPKGLYFWNGSEWIFLDKNNIEDITLQNTTTPPGTTEGQLAYNVNPDVDTEPKGLLPRGVVYWNLDNWVTLEVTSPFITSIKDAFESAMTVELCGDYEIQEDKIFLGQYEDFYTHTELGQFLINPSKDIKEYWNDRFKINNFGLAYDTFETNRLSKNTADDIHTQAEWSIPNVYVENKLERSSKYIRSAFSSQAMVDLETNTPATADDNDDKVFINTIVELPIGTLCEFQLTLTNTISIDGKLHLSNTNSAGASSEVLVNWNTRGLTIGQTFTITSGHNAASYTVESYSSSDLVLIPPISYTPTHNGDDNISVSYEYIDVFWQTKTNEGLGKEPGVGFTENLDNPDRYPNLDFTLRRNLSNWENYLSTACFFKPDSTIKNLYYRNNPPLKSQVIGQPIYTEKANILVSDLPTPILTPKMFDVEVYAGYTEILDLLDHLKLDRGYIVCYDQNGRKIKGYIFEMDYTWKTGSLKLKLEERYEKSFITITSTDIVMIVTDPDYNVTGQVGEFKIVGQYLSLFGTDKKPLVTKRLFSEVKLNGMFYNSVDSLYDALLSI